MRTLNYQILGGCVLVSIIGILIWMNQNQEVGPESTNKDVAIEIRLGNDEQENIASVREASYTIPRTFRYRFIATNRTGNTLENVKLTTFSPLAITATQKLIKLEANESFNLIEDVLGNKAMEFFIEKVPPYAKKVFSIEAQLMMANKPQQSSQGPRSIYLKNEALLDMDNEEIRKVASRLRLNNDEESARAIYNWVKNNLVYSGYISSDMGAGYAIRTKQGDCTEYAYLLTALARINKIPARIMAGFVYSHNSVLRPRDYHNWVELYINDRWNIVDPLNEVFFDHKASYVSLRILGSGGHLSYLGSQKGIESSPGLEIKMQ